MVGHGDEQNKQNSMLAAFAQVTPSKSQSATPQGILPVLDNRSHSELSQNNVPPQPFNPSQVNNALNQLSLGQVDSSSSEPGLVKNIILQQQQLI